MDSWSLEIVACLNKQKNIVITKYFILILVFTFKPLGTTLHFLGSCNIKMHWHHLKKFRLMGANSNPIVLNNVFMLTWFVSVKRSVLLTEKFAWISKLIKRILPFSSSVILACTTLKLSEFCLVWVNFFDPRSLSTHSHIRSVELIQRQTQTLAIEVWWQLQKGTDVLLCLGSARTHTQIHSRYALLRTRWFSCRHM